MASLQPTLAFATHRAQTTDSDVKKSRLKAGQCELCGQQTHQVVRHRFRKPTLVPLSDEYVLKGRCLLCRPIAAAHAPGPDRPSRPPDNADVPFSFTSQNNPALPARRSAHATGEHPSRPAPPLPPKRGDGTSLTGCLRGRRYDDADCTAIVSPPKKPLHQPARRRPAANDATAATVPSGGDPAESGSTSSDGSIDRVFQASRKARQDDKIGILLLGCEKSGKSTILEQMRTLHGPPRNDDDLRMYGAAIRSNVVEMMRTLCSQLRELGLERNLDDESAERGRSSDGSSPRQAYDELVAHLVDYSAPPAQDATEDRTAAEDWVLQGAPRTVGQSLRHDATQFLRLAEAIRILWQSKTMRYVWSEGRRSAALNAIESHEECLNDIGRISAPSYRPNARDIALARVRTTRAVVESFRIDGIDYEMYDIGGHKAERRSWIDRFGHVDAVIFVADLSVYDRTVSETRCEKNCMVESLELFRYVCNNRAFANTSIMLFLNKKDIFAEKILHSDIAAQAPFSDYDGPPRDFNCGVLYFISKFKGCPVDSEFSDSFIHVTCAADTNNMEFVLDSTRTIIMTDSLRRSGFLG